MTERGMLFSAPMVRAILDGTKTQTRRIAKWETRPWAEGTDLSFSGLSLGHYATGVPSSGYVLRTMRDGCWNDVTYPLHVPYGEPGDRIYVRETWQPVWAEAERPPTGDGPGNGWAIKYPATDGIVEYHDNDTDEITQRCRPSIHMPRWASRIDLDIISVRVERLNDISEEDAQAEGVAGKNERLLGVTPHRARFANLWDSINGPGAWAINPFVWVYEFKRVKP